MSSGSRGRRGSNAARASLIGSSNTTRAQLSLKDFFCRREAPSPAEASENPLVVPSKKRHVASAKENLGGPSGGPSSCCLRSERGAPSAPASMVIDLTEVEEACACSVQASQHGGFSPGVESVAVIGAFREAVLKTETDPPAGSPPARTRVLPWERSRVAAASSGIASFGRKSPGAGTEAAAAPAAADPVAVACAAAGLPVAEIETRALPTLRLLLPLRLCISAAATYLQHLLLPDEFECIQTLARLLGMPAAVVLSAATARGPAATAKATGTATLPEAAASAAAAVAEAKGGASEATAAEITALATSTITVTTAAAATSANSAEATATATVVPPQSTALSAAAVEVVQSTTATLVLARATAAASAETGATTVATREGLACAAAAISIDTTASARLSAPTSGQDSAATAAAESAATVNAISSAAATSAASELASLPQPVAASAKVAEPLSEGAQLLFARLVLHLLRLSFAPTGPPEAMRRVSRSSSSNSSNFSNSSWIRLPPLLRVSRELPSAAAALRELQAPGLLFLWTPQTSPVPFPLGTSAAAARPTAPVAAGCGRCAAAVDGLCACSWSSALLCLSLGELRDVLSSALRALGAHRETWGPPAKLKTRGEIVSFLQRLAAGHKPANNNSSNSSSSRRLEEFFGTSVICESKISKDILGAAKLPAAVVDAIRSIRMGVVEICRCLAQLKQQQLLLQSLRVAFLATHAPHAAALGSMAATAPGYVVAAAGHLLQQMQQQHQQMQQQQMQQQNEEDLFAIACAAMLPAVQRVSHLVDLRLRQLPSHVLLQQQHQRPSQQQEKPQEASENSQQCSLEPQLLDKTQQEPSAQTSTLPHDLKLHSHDVLIGRNGGRGSSNTHSAELDSSSVRLEELSACASPERSTVSSTKADSAMAGATEVAAEGEAQAAAAFAVARTGAALATEASRLLPIWVCSCSSCAKQRTTAIAPAASSRRKLALFAAALLAELRMSFVAPEAARATTGSARSAAAAAGAAGAASAAEAEALQLAVDAERELRVHISERQEASVTAVAPSGRQCGYIAAQPSSCKAVPGAPAEATATAAAAVDSTEVHLLRFSAPYAWASVLWQSVQLLEQRRQYAAAVERLLLLLQLHELYSIRSAALESATRCTGRADDDPQEHQQLPQKAGVFRHRVGRWFNRLTVLLQQHLQQPQRAIVEGVRCLRDAGALRKAERQEITRRIIKAAASLQRKRVASTWEELQAQAVQQEQHLQQLQHKQQVLVASDLDNSGASVSSFSREAHSTNEADESSSSYSSSTSTSRTCSDSERRSSSSQRRAPSRGSRRRPSPRRVPLRKRRRPADTPNSRTGSRSLCLQRGQQWQGQQQPAFLQLLPVDVHNTVLQEYAEHALLQEQLPLCVVPARPLAATAAAGRSSVFIGWDGLLLRVEQLALQHYCMHGGWQGAHDEGTCLRSIFLILTAAQQQQQQQAEASNGVQQLQQHSKHIEALDATSSVEAAAAVAEGEVAYSVAFLPSVNPMEETLLPEQQQQQARLLQQLQRSTRREVYNVVKRSVAAVYGQQIRGVCWNWRSLADGGYSNADEEQQQQQQQEQQQPKSEQREDDEGRDTESDVDALDPWVKQRQNAPQQDATAATACGHFYGRIAAAIGGPSLASTFSLLSEDFRSWAPGLPDLILWRSRPSNLQLQQRETEQQGQGQPPRQLLDPERQLQTEPRQRSQQQQQQHGVLDDDDDNFAEWEVMFAEVKGPRDSLSDKQKCWLLRFLAAGIPSQICRIAEPQVAERMQQKQQEKDCEQVEAASLKQAAQKRHSSTRARAARKKAEARQRAQKPWQKRKDVCDEPDAAAISRIARPNRRR